MRSYTNRDGEKIVVDEAHLNAAVEIKKFLQDSSPSRKCSWKKLVKLMKKEGFDNAEPSESYRCMLKAYQKSIGELPEVTKHAEMVTDSKIGVLKDLVGEVYVEKEENKHVLRELNKLRREISRDVIVAEQIGEAFKNHIFELPKMQYRSRAKKAGKELIVCLSDLHIGALVDNEHNFYNYEIAQRRLQDYLNEIIDTCVLNGVTKVHVVNVGDVIEHSTMRYGMAYNVEFTSSEQIVKAFDIIIQFLVGLAEHVDVEYAGFAGNHDRLDSDKNKNIDGDHVVRMVNASIQNFIKYSGIKEITYVQAKDYEHSLELNGVKFKFLHGDLDSLKDENLVAKHSVQDSVDYNHVIMGHFHHARSIEVGYNKSIITFGTLKGPDDYTVKIRKLAAPSQGMILVNTDGTIDVKKVTLS